MARARTTKELVERIDLGYFKRPHPKRTWMRMIIVAAFAGAGIWLTIDAIWSGQRAYMPGPVSLGHAMFSQQCGQCHAPTEGETYWRRVSDQACLKCHDGPIHHPNQTFTPNCASCHREHQGRSPLAHVADQHCAQCHTNLTTTGSLPHSPGCLVKGHEIERRIDDFNENHPEFAVIRAQYEDAARIKLNHQVHLKPNLKGLDKLRSEFGVVDRDGARTLDCSYCHQPDDRQSYMAAINFEKHCMECHPLLFDARLPDLPVPHEQFDRVIPFVQERFSRYILAHPEEMRMSRIEPVRRLPGQSQYEELPSTAKGWVDRQVQVTRRLLVQKTCKECHWIERENETLPSVVQPAIPNRWLVHSRFDHKAHRALTCHACHQQVSGSQKTTDLLLPRISSCQECHNPSSARTSCATCHFYHDKSRGRGVGGRLAIEQLLSDDTPVTENGRN